MATIEKEKVNFLRGNKEDYNGLAEKNNNTIYFILDTHEIYVGDKLFSTLDFGDLINIPYIPTEEEMQGIFNALLEKQPKEEGKGLSTNDFTDEFKTKLISLFNYDDSDIKSSIASLNTALEEEAGKREALASALAEETQSREALGVALDAEVATRESLQTDLNNEISNRQSADSNLNTALEEEANERAALGTALAAETVARESLRADLASEISARQSEDAKLNEALARETEERETVGLALLEEVQAREAVGRALTTEIADRKALGVDLANEVTNRQNADANLQVNIDNETNARIQAISEEANTRAQAITAEANARKQGLIDEANARNSADLVLQNNINNEQNARIQAVSEEITNRNNAVNNVQRNIDAETNVRIAADTAINSLITAIKKQLFDETNNFLGFIDINNSADAYKYLINDEERKTWSDGKYAIAFLEDKIKARKEEIVTVTGQGARPQNPGEQDAGKQPVVVTMKGIGANNKFYKSSIISRPEAVLTMDIYSDDWFAKTGGKRIVITNVVDTNGLLSSITSVADPHSGTPLQGWEEDYTDTSINFNGHTARKMISMDNGHQDNIKYYQATYPGEGTPFVLKFNTENIDQEINGVLHFTVQFQEWKKPTIGAGSWKKSNEADVTFDVPYTFVATQEEKYYQGIYRLTNSKVVQYIPEDHATQQWVEENYATKTELSNWRQYRVVSNLDDVAEPQSNIIYLVYNANYSSTDNVYDEYIWVTEKGVASYWEHLGSTAINIQNYQKKLTAGDNITIDENNVINTQLASPSQTGVVKIPVGCGISVDKDGSIRSIPQIINGNDDINAELHPNERDYRLIFNSEKYAKSADTYNKTETDSKITETVNTAIQNSITDVLGGVS